MNENKTKCVECSKQFDGCGKCDTTSSKCLECESNRYFMSKITDKCIECSEVMNNCTTCSNSITCTSCDDGLFVDPKDHSCKKCEEMIKGCVTCSNTGTCLLCDIENKYKLSLDYSRCEKIETIDENCIKYDGMYGHCVKCKDGYIQIDEVCESCQIFGSCKNCTTNGCIECDTGMMLSKGQCYKRTEGDDVFIDHIPGQNISEEENPIQGKCRKGYYLRNNNTCIPCQVKGCILCGETENKCLECNLLKGYRLNKTSQTCEKCCDNCAHCGKDGECIQCEEGYYYKEEHCFKCSYQELGCTKCTAKGNKFICLGCDDKHYLNPNNQTCLSIEIDEYKETTFNKKKCSNELIHCSRCGYSKKNNQKNDNTNQRFGFFDFSNPKSAVELFSTLKGPSKFFQFYQDWTKNLPIFRTKNSLKGAVFFGIYFYEILFLEQKIRILFLFLKTENFIR